MSYGSAAHVYMIGVHAAHGHEHAYSLSDVAYLLRRKPPNSIPVLLGDFNSDLLPIQPSGPFADQPDRFEHHRVERQNLFELLNTFGLHILPVGAVKHSPVKFSSSPPYTRMPLGDQHGLPAFLDCSLSGSPLYAVCMTIDWCDSPSDHAFIHVPLPRVHELSTQLAQRRSRAWHPVSHSAFIDMCKHQPPPSSHMLKSYVSTFLTNKHLYSPL